MPTTPATAQTVDRAMAVLDAIAEHGDRRMADIVRRTGLERRIAGRLLASLVAAHLVDATESGYELGARLIELGALAERRNGLRARAQPIAESLMHAVDATVIVHRLNDHELSPVLVSMPTHVLALSYPHGRRIPFHQGVGRAALAWLPESEIQAVLHEAGLPLDDARSAQLKEIRATGVAVSHGEIVRGVTAVGSAARRADGVPIAVVVVVAPEGTHLERHATKVAQAAAALSDVIRVPALP